MIIACIISFVVGAFVMMCAIGLMSYRKDKVPLNKVHFYVARDTNTELGLWFGKPYRGVENWVCVDYSVLIASGDEELNLCGLDIKDYDSLKWEDEPVEVFLDLED